MGTAAVLGNVIILINREYILMWEPYEVLIIHVDTKCGSGIVVKIRHCAMLIITAFTKE